MREPDRLSPAGALPIRIKSIPTSSAMCALKDAGANHVAPEPAPPVAAPHRGWRRLALTAGAIALLWGGLTGWDPASWVFGAPVVIAATTLAFRFAPAPHWRLSPTGAIRFAGWFVVNSFRSGLSVAGRALGWQLALTPGFRGYRTSLPAGPARIFFANAITLLPGTLSAEVSDDRIEVHMLDTGSAWEAELADLEARVRELFALPARGGPPQDRRSISVPMQIEDRT